MGNSSSSSGRGHHDETVDYGLLCPQGVYTGTRDWNQAVVTQLICARRLAPFYRPLEDYDESWDDDQILAARKVVAASEPDSNETITRIEAPSPSLTPSKSGHNKKVSNLKEPSKPEAAVYRGAVECPICFLYYPPNINHSRCCDQAICTECFVQIKRNEPTTTHLVSEPSACPYCVQDNFGVVYTPPPWRAGIGSESSPLWAESSKGAQQSSGTPSYPTHKRRQKSFGADSPEVVTTDQIRPDWEAKLAAVRAAVARRANRRIIMRQVGDRLIPVGVTSGRVHPLSPEDAQAEGVDNGGSRRRRRQQAAQNQNFEQFMGMGGQDLEELMLMEAMRLSMIDHEEHQRKEAEKKKQEEAATSAAVQSENEVASTSTSTSEVTTSHLISLSPSPSTSSPSSSGPVPISQARPHDSLTVESNSFLSSLSRSRTPPPQGASTNSHRSSLSSSSIRHRSPSPAQYSTLTAAMTAATTASAILGSSVAIGDNGSITNSATNLPSTPGTSTEDSIASLHVSSNVGDQPPRSTPPHHDQASTEVSHSYDNLPSSPESLIAYEPLLGSRAAPEEHVL